MSELSPINFTGPGTNLVTINQETEVIVVGLTGDLIPELDFTGSQNVQSQFQD